MKILTDPRSGSYQGITSSRNRFGQYVRTRAIPVQPRTPKQTSTRAFLTLGSSNWRSLSDTERTGWNDYAAQLGRSDSLGSSYQMTGAMLYSGATVMLGGAVIGVPDALPNYLLGVSDIAYVDPTPGPEALTVTLVTTSAENRFIVDTSGPISPGLTSSAAVRRWRTLPFSATNLQPRQFAMAASPVPILTQYKFLFPSPTIGQVIWFRFREIAYPGTSGIPVTNKSMPTFRFIVV